MFFAGPVDALILYEKLEFSDDSTSRVSWNDDVIDKSHG